MSRINNLAGLNVCVTAAVGLLFWLVATNPAWAVENLVGKRVTAIHWGAEFHDQKDVVIGSSEIGKTYEVYAVKGKKLFVKENEGYLLRTDVVPYETAENHFTLRVKRKPSAEVYYDRGCFLQNEEQFDAALKDFDEALRRDRKHVDAYNARAGVWWSKEELDKAIDDYTQAIKLDPKHCWAHSNRGQVWLVKGEDERAMQDFTDAIRIDRAFASAYKGRAEVRVRRGELDKAIEDYDQAVLLEPTEVDTLLERGRVWYRKGNSKNAVDDFNEVIRRDPKNEGAFFSRGGVWANEGLYISAAADYERLMEINPQSVTAYVSMALLRAACPDANVRDGQRAMKVVQKLKELVDWENSPEYHETLAATYAELGDFDQAVEWQSKIVPRLKGEAQTAATTRLKLYEEKKPYRLVPIKPGKPAAEKDPDAQ